MSENPINLDNIKYNLTIKLANDYFLPEFKWQAKDCAEFCVDALMDHFHQMGNMVPTKSTPDIEGLREVEEEFNKVVGIFSAVVISKENQESSVTKIMHYEYVRLGYAALEKLQAIIDQNGGE